MNSPGKGLREVYSGLLARRGSQLAILGLLLLGSLLPWRFHSGGPSLHGTGSDQPLHTTMIHRLQAGDSYYAATGDELRRRHFPTASPFNWRTPLLFSAIALNPFVARVTFVALGLLVIAGTVRLLARESLAVVIAGGLAQAGAVMVIFDPDVWVFHEVWAGFLIAISVFAYTMKRPAVGATLGLAALFVRELAAPYVLLCVALAVRKGRRWEAALWAAGLTAYGLHYAWHVAQVMAHQHAGEPAHAAGWIQFAGLSFVVQTLRTNSLLYKAPVAAASGAFLVVAAGLFAGTVPARIRYTVAVYILFFAAVGQAFNWYWGWVPGFLLPLVFSQGIPTLWSLAGRAAWSGSVRESDVGLS